MTDNIFDGLRGYIEYPCGCKAKILVYAGNGQVGFLASKRLDGKLVLPEAIKVLQMKA